VGGYAVVAASRSYRWTDFDGLEAGVFGQESAFWGLNYEK